MSPFMIYFVSVGGESPSAMLAQVGFLSRVSPYVMAETCALRKSTCAIRVRACIWLDPQVYIPVS